MKIMRIALLTDGIYPYIMGGMQKHSYYLVKYFVKHKIYVDLYHIYDNNNKKEAFSLNAFDEKEKEYIRSFPFKFPKLNSLPGHYIHESYECSVNIFNTFIKNKNVDFVYAQGFSGWKLIEEKRKGFKFPPIGVNFHGLNVFQMPASLRAAIEYRFIFKKPVLFNLINADVVFSLGGKLTGILQKNGISSEKIVEIPIGIDSDWIKTLILSENKKRKFIFIGRYDKVKGIVLLNDVIRELNKKYHYEFHFIGPIPKEKQIISEAIFYHGLISDQEKIKTILGYCDVLVCSSFSEGMPTVILEAMASGLSVISTDVGAVSCLVNTENGWLIEPGSKSQLLYAIENAIIIDENSLLEKKRSCQKLIKENYLWDIIIKQTIDQIDKRIS